MSETPRIGRPLPNAHEAVIPPGKLLGYALDPEHGRGRHKAVVFQRALGIGPEDVAYLEDAILGQLPQWPVTDVRPPQHPRGEVTWEVLVPVRGLGPQAGRRLKVVTGWRIVEGRPSLATIRVAGRKRQ